MRLPLSKLSQVYEKIMDNINVNNVSVIIFCNVDADSICTLRILSKVLKTQQIHFKAHPITTYTELKDKIELERQTQTIRIYFFINCGSILNLDELNLNENAQIFVFDIHRPICPSNLASTRVKIIENDNQNYYRIEDFQRHQELQNLADDDEGQQQDDLDDGFNSPKRKHKIAQNQDFLKKHRKIQQEKFQNYYNYEYFALPSSYIAYKFAKQIKKDTNQILWYSIVGITSMLIDKKLKRQLYDQIQTEIRKDVIKNNPLTEKIDKGCIKCEIDFMLPFLNHWSIYQSMMQSPQMIINMELWNEKGIEKLQAFLSCIGISLETAKQMYKFIPNQLKSKFKSEMMRFSEKFNIVAVSFPSFIRQTDSYMSITAQDYAYIIINTLQLPNKDLNMEGEQRIFNFWQAYEIFQKSLNYFSQQVQLAKKSISFITDVAINILSKDEACKCRTFYFFHVKSDLPEKKIFKNPYTLIRLAELLMNIKNKTQKNNLPLLASYFRNQQQVCTVVGVSRNEKNNFGKRFSNTVAALNIQSFHDGIRANIIAISKDNLKNFIKKLEN